MKDIITKYVIMDLNIYNFDKTGFMISIISIRIVVINSDDRK